MKKIQFITILILLLVSAPSTTFLICCTETQLELAEENSESSECPEEGECNPFILCHCCNGFVNPFLSDQFAVYQNIEVSKNEQTVKILKEFENLIWQPPKV